MEKIKYYIKEFTGGQDLNRRQRAIFMWWASSLTLALIFAECFWLCSLMVASFGIASQYLQKEVPVPDDDSPEI